MSLVLFLGLIVVLLSALRGDGHSSRRATDAERVAARVVVAARLARFAIEREERLARYEHRWRRSGFGHGTGHYVAEVRR